VAASVPRAESVSAAVDAFAETVAAWPDGDPRRVELAAVRQLAARLDDGTGDWRMSELLVNMMRQLAVDPDLPATVVDRLRAQEAAARVRELVPPGVRELRSG
jgi:hypothetical protein